MSGEHPYEPARDFGTYHKCIKAFEKDYADISSEVRVFVYIRPFCMRAKALVSWHICAASSVPSLLNNVISTRISYAGS